MSAFKLWCQLSAVLETYWSAIVIDDNDAVMTAKICEPIYESSNISTMLILYLMDLLSRIKSYLFSKPCDDPTFGKARNVKHFGVIPFFQSSI